MLSVACILRNTQLKTDLSALVEGLAFHRAANFGKASLKSIFTDLRKAGIEVDLKTVGYIYADTLPLHEEAFDSLADIEDMVGDDFRKLSNAIINSTPRVADKRTGQNSPEAQGAKALARVFYNAHTSNTVNKTVMLEMQEALIRGARRLTGEVAKPVRSQEDYEDILHRAMSVETKGYTDMKGHLNGIQDLYNSFKVELQKYADKIDADTTLPPQEKAIMKAQFQEYTKTLQASSYQLLFSEPEARKVLTGLLKDAGFAKPMASGKTVIDWVKLSGEINSPVAIRDNVQSALENKGYTQQQINGVKAALEQEFIDMHAEILERAEKNLSGRAVKATTVKSATKSDLQKLVELNNLGIFNSQYQVVLNRALNVTALSSADMADIRTVAQQVTELQKEMDAGKIFGSYPFQIMHNRINQIVARNTANRTGLMKAVSAIDQTFQVINAAIISNPPNLAENNISGFKEVGAMNNRIRKEMGGYFVGKEKEYLRAVWKDVARGGIGYGNEPYKFSHRVSFDERLNHPDANHSKFKNAARMTAKGIMFVSRAFLSASDSAFKAVLHRKALMLMIHEALVKDGMTKDQANVFMNEALYGQKLDDAKAMAKDILDRYDLPSDNNSVVRFANEIVIGNLETGQLLTREHIDAAKKAAYEVAGVGLGHETQNIVGRWIKDVKQASARRAEELIKKGDNNALAINALTETFVHSVVLRYMGGIFNWISLRLQSGFGLGLVSGAISGRWRNTPDFNDRKEVEETFKEAHLARQKMWRSATGLATTLVIYGIVKAIAYGSADDKDKRSDLEQLFAAIKEDYELWRFFKKLAPELMMFHASVDTSKDGLEAGLKYVQNFFNLGDQYSTGGRISEAITQAHRGKTEKAEGEIGAIPGGMFEFPLYRTVKGWYEYGEWAVDHAKGWTGNKAAASAAKAIKPNFSDPDTFFNGLLMGGFVEDFGKATGLYQRQHPLSSIPGVGYKTKEILLKHGITDLKSFKKANWESLHDEGTKVFSKKEAVKIKAYLAEN